MTDNSKRRLLQIHLLTVVVLLIQVGLLIPFFIATRHHWLGDTHLFVGLMGLAIVSATSFSFETFLRKTARIELHIAVAIVLVFAGAMLANEATKRANAVEMKENERQMAEYKLKEFAEAEEIYHRIDHSGAGTLCYSRHLSGSDGQSLYGAGLLDLVFANAEAPPGPAYPMRGYLFKVLTGQGSNAAGGKRSYLDEKNLMLYGYALVAYPAEYLASGRDTFMINGNGTIFIKDLGPNTSKIADEMTAFNPDSSWIPVQ